MISKSDRVVSTIAVIILTIFSFVAILPFWLMIASSMSSESSIALYGCRTANRGRQIHQIIFLKDYDITTQLHLQQRTLISYRADYSR